MDPPNSRAKWENMNWSDAWDLCREAQEKFGAGPELEHIEWLGKQVNKDLEWMKNMRCLDSWKLCVRAIRWKKYNPQFRKFALRIANTIKTHKVAMYYDLYKQHHAEAIARGLTEGHAENRARRYTLKIFLAHFWMVSYAAIHDEAPPESYAIDVLGGAKRLVVPNWPFKFSLTS
jgi:predicted transcriptional regulator